MSEFYLIHRTLSGATTQDQSGPEIDGNKGVLCIPQSSSITGASTSDCSMSYPRHLLGEVLLRCRDVVSVFYSSPLTGQWVCVETWKLECSIKIRGHTKKKKRLKRLKRSKLKEEII